MIAASLASRRRLGLVLLLMFSVVTAAALLLIQRGQADRSTDPAPQVAANTVKPTLLLVTSLPLIFGEGFSLDAGGSAALTALESRYRVVPIGVTDVDQLTQGRLLLMAHPRAQPAEALVDLDRWVRGGNRMVLLADPRLEWRSERPLGDRLRPPPAFADTGLLGHWGVRLEPPEKAGPVTASIDGRTLRLRSPGRLSPTSPKCVAADSGLTARCRVGKGTAVIVADADFLDVERLGEEERSANLEFLLSELKRLER